MSFSKCFWRSFANRAQTSSKNIQTVLKFASRKGEVIHPPSKNRGLWVISLSMSMVLNKKNLLLGVKKRFGSHICSLLHFTTKCDRYYYKIRQLFYYKVRQKFIAKCVKFVITKCDIYYKIRCFLQNASVQSQQLI